MTSGGGGDGGRQSLGGMVSTGANAEIEGGREGGRKTKHSDYKATRKARSIGAVRAMRTGLD